MSNQANPARPYGQGDVRKETKDRCAGMGYCGHKNAASALVHGVTLASMYRAGDRPCLLAGN